MKVPSAFFCVSGVPSADRNKYEIFSGVSSVGLIGAVASTNSKPLFRRFSFIASISSSFDIAKILTI